MHNELCGKRVKCFIYKQFKELIKFITEPCL